MYSEPRSFEFSKHIIVIQIAILYIIHLVIGARRNDILVHMHTLVVVR